MTQKKLYTLLNHTRKEKYLEKLKEDKKAQVKRFILFSILVVCFIGLISFVSATFINHNTASDFIGNFTNTELDGNSIILSHFNATDYFSSGSYESPLILFNDSSFDFNFVGLNNSDDNLTFQFRLCSNEFCTDSGSINLISFFGTDNTSSTYFDQNTTDINYHYNYTSGFTNEGFYLNFSDVISGGGFNSYGGSFIDSSYTWIVDNSNLKVYRFYKNGTYSNFEFNTSEGYDSNTGIWSNETDIYILDTDSPKKIRHYDTS
jgi:hypothetical protein